MKALLLALLTAFPAPPTPGHPTEVLAWASVDRDGRSELVVADGSGQEAFPVGGGLAVRGRPSVSAHGDGVAVSVPIGEETGRYAIARIGFDGHETLLSNPVFADTDPDWSPGGTAIVAVRRTCPVLARITCTSLVRFSAVGDGSVQTLVRSSGVLHDPAWSHDSTRIAYTDSTGLWLVPAAGGPARRVIRAHGLRQPRWSADDGRIVMVQHLGPSRDRLLVLGTTTFTTVVLTHAANALDSPQWAPDGEHLVMLAYTGEGDAGRRGQKLVVVGFDRSVGTLRRLPSLVHGLGLGAITAGS